ncbi:uncharacterized protein LOC121860174 [Homarus americanus]|uniref:non-specific serine/threonine protein kinase n=1 Tax=Homarus americanus TaxID=6706 RepID=A0A8J5N5X3_HOMAM|nr:uncharacterized protein LOC121860174 [Homarus americanus]KAG7173652.1 serine/threonine-protein kinase Nek1-like 3 [Homarus americanus]
MDESSLKMEDYKIIRQLGLGSYGAAHLAHHDPSDTKCVIKEINISQMSPKELEEARREVQVLSSLSHPYITQFRGSCEENGRLSIAMDYCGGGDLHTIISKRKGVHFPEDRVLDWFVQLCLAIKYTHDRKILHRDIKSQNIFLTDDGKIRLGDFGIAKVLNNTSDLARTCIGTPYYLSPEMCENKPYNNKSDIWALGCVLYEMMTLKHAFEANNMKALILKIIRGIYQPVPARYSRDLRLLLTQIFQRQPQARPSISVILRKSFIFKRVPRFISGCEEEELKASLIKRRCTLPASVRKIPVPKRPHDITDPSAKYGVSQSLNKRGTYKSPTKATSKVYKQVCGVKKPVGVAHSRADRLSQEHRKKYQSENSLLPKDAGIVEPTGDKDKRFQRRSKSVPHAFKQSNLKSQQQNVKNKHPSPVKLQLMLDSAGFKKNADVDPKKMEAGEIVNKSKEDEEPIKSPGAEGWLVDEFLSKKLQAAYIDRKLAEALVPTNTSESESVHDDSSTAAMGNKRDRQQQNGRDFVIKNLIAQRSPKLKVRPKNKPAPHVRQTEKDQRKHSDDSHDVQVQETNPKDVKELANKTLKHDNICSDEEGDEDIPRSSAEELRELMQEKMKKLLQERTQKMNQMISQRRQWAYKREKLESALVKKRENVLIVEKMEETTKSNDIERREDRVCESNLHSCVPPSESQVELEDKVYNGINATVRTAPANESQFNEEKKNKCQEPDEVVNRDSSTKPKPQRKKSIMSPDITETYMNEVPNNTLVSTVRERITPEKLSVIPAENLNNPQTQETLIDNTSVGILSEPQEELVFNEKNKSLAYLDKCGDRPNNGNLQVCEVTSKEIVITCTNVPEKPTSVTLSNDDGGVSGKHGDTALQSSNTQSLTPSKRSRWRSADTAGLENSPLETTASEMDCTTSSDLVVVYKEMGERKQWGKHNKDIISVLSKAQIIESPMNQSSSKRKENAVNELEKVTKEINFSGKNLEEVSNKPKVLNSTFTVSLKDCHGDCEPGPCKIGLNSAPDVKAPCKMKPSVPLPSVLNSTFEVENKNTVDNKGKLNQNKEELGRTQTVETAGSVLQTNVDKSCKNKQSDKILHPKVNETVNVKKNGNRIGNKSEGISKIENKEEMGKIEVVGKAITENREEIGKIEVVGKGIRKLSTSVTSETVQTQNEAVKNDSLIIDDTEKSFNDTYTVDEKLSESTFTIPKTPSKNADKKGKGRFLEKLRLHMSPLPKKKQIVVDKFSVPAQVTPRKTIGDLGLGAEHKTSTPILKKKTKIKSGLVGILRRLSSRQDINVDTANCMEKGSIETCEKSYSDSELSGDTFTVECDAKTRKSQENVTSNQVNNYENMYNKTISKTCNRILQSSETDNKEDKGYMSSQKTLENEGKSKSQRREATNMKDGGTGTIGENIEPEETMTIKNNECHVGKEISGNIQSDSDTFVVGKDITDQQNSKSIDTKVKGTEELTFLKDNTLANSLKEIYSRDNASKDNVSVNNFDNVSSDSGLDTQKTDFTCQMLDNVASDTQSDLDYTLGNFNRLSPSQSHSCGLSECNLTFSENYNPSATLKNNEVSLILDEHCKKTEVGSVVCVEDLANTLLLDVFEEARRQISGSETRRRDQDISPITPRNIQINLKCSGEVKYQGVQHECGVEALPTYSQTLVPRLGASQGLEGESIQDGNRSKHISQGGTSKYNHSEVSRGTSGKVVSHITSNPLGRISDSDLAHHTSEDIKVTHSSARPRPTVLCISSNNNERLFADLAHSSILQTQQNVKEDGRSRKKFLENKNYEEITTKQKYLGTSTTLPQQSTVQSEASKSNIDLRDSSPGVNKEEFESRCKDFLFPYQYSKDDFYSVSDEESEDLANLRRSMELVLCSGRQSRESDCKSVASSYTSSEVWHLDRDGAVVMGGGGVYGWIEEQRAKLEDVLGLDLFMKAYHHLDVAQEREGCVVGEAVSQVEEMLGRDARDLAHDILQLVVSEAVYHNQ